MHGPLRLGSCFAGIGANVIALNEARLAICLALIAGYVDACGFRAFGTYVSFMSGNTTRMGMMSGEGNLVAALPAALAIAFFVAGSFVGTWLAQTGVRQSRRVLFGVVGTLLAATVSFMPRGAPDAKIEIVILSLAMGILNNTLSRVGSEVVSLTFVTGDLNRVGSHLALAVKRAPLQDALGPRDTHLRRARLLASVWAAFLTGAVLFGAARSYFGVWILLPPVLILLALALFNSTDGAPT
jgi:uncharacterized membrane protein YoaK (UPF0700 family)